MKAKEYYEIYKSRILNPDNNIAVAAAKDLICDLLKEAMDLVDKRHIVKRSSFEATFREQKQKHTAICALATKDTGLNILNPYGFNSIANAVFADSGMPKLFSEEQKQ